MLTMWPNTFCPRREMVTALECRSYIVPYITQANYHCNALTGFRELPHQDIDIETIPAKLRRRKQFHRLRSPCASHGVSANHSHPPPNEDRDDTIEAACLIVLRSNLTTAQPRPILARWAGCSHERHNHKRSQPPEDHSRPAHQRLLPLVHLPRNLLQPDPRFARSTSCMGPRRPRLHPRRLHPPVRSLESDDASRATLPTRSLPRLRPRPDDLARRQQHPSPPHRRRHAHLYLRRRPGSFALHHPQHRHPRKTPRHLRPRPDVRRHCRPRRHATSAFHRRYLPRHLSYRPARPSRSSPEPAGADTTPLHPLTGKSQTHKDRALDHSCPRRHRPPGRYRLAASSLSDGYYLDLRRHDLRLRNLSAWHARRSNRPLAGSFLCKPLLPDPQLSRSDRPLRTRSQNLSGRPRCVDVASRRLRSRHSRLDAHLRHRRRRNHLPHAPHPHPQSPTAVRRDRRTPHRAAIANL